MLTKKVLGGYTYIQPCPVSPSLNTEARVILLKPQASIKILQEKEKVEESG